MRLVYPPKTVAVRFERRGRLRQGLFDRCAACQIELLEVFFEVQENVRRQARRICLIRQAEVKRLFPKYGCRDLAELDVLYLFHNEGLNDKGRIGNSPTARHLPGQWFNLDWILSSHLTISLRESAA
jgi:hypothetical protein